MEGSTEKSLNIGVTIVIALVVITVVFGIVMLGMRIANNSSSKISDITGQLDESTYTSYQGVTIKGDQLIGIIKQFEGSQTGVYVETGTPTSYIYELSVGGDDTATLPDEPLTRTEESQRLMLAQDKTSDTYISPVGNFVGTVLRNPDTNAITGLSFKRVEDITH